jgi:hypothetical protein
MSPNPQFVRGRSRAEGAEPTLWLILCIAIFVLGLAPSCGNSAESRSVTSGSPTGSTSEDDVPPEARCAGGKTRPLSLENVIDAGRERGITLDDDPECTDPTVARRASNIRFYGDKKNSDERDEIEKREGLVMCDLRAEPDSPPTVKRIRYSGDEETHFELLNVGCTIYPERASAEEQVRRLEQVMEDLAKNAQR